MNSTDADGGEIDAGPLAGVSVVNGSFVRDGDAVVLDGEGESDAEAQERFKRVVSRLVTSDRFRGFVGWVYNRTGRWLKVQALQVGEGDEDFREACDLLYTDLKDGVLGPYIDAASGPALERILVYGVGFGGPLYKAYGEIRARERAPEPDRKPEPIEPVEEEDDNE